MDPKHRVVTRLPVEEVWREDGSPISVQKLRPLQTQDIANLLQLGPVNFIIADIGMPLRWIDLTDCYRFWKTEIKVHLAAPDQKPTLDGFPGGYFYFASEWQREEKFPIVILERHH
jgi:hypothetical protein